MRNAENPARRLIILLALLTVVTTEGRAQQADWKGEGALGLTATTGNTATRNLTAKLALSHDSVRWRHAGNLEALRSKTSGETTAERYVVAGKTDYKLNPTLYVFAALRRENDKFSSFLHQTSVVAGMGDRLIDDGRMALDLSAGVGVRGSTVRTTDDAEREPILRGNGVFAYEFNSSVSVREEVLIESGGRNTYVESTSSLNAKVSTRLAARISVLVKHNSLVTAGTEKSDTLTTTSLVYAF